VIKHLSGFCTGSHHHSKAGIVTLPGTKEPFATGIKIKSSNQGMFQIANQEGWASDLKPASQIFIWVF